MTDLPRAVPEPMRFPGPAPCALSVDVEEWFHVCGHGAERPVAEWGSLPSNVERGLGRTLDLLAGLEVRATAFFLGWVAKSRPDLVRAVQRAGHEIASHGMTHRRLDGMSISDRAAELRESRRLLEDISGVEVRGFRAPEWSVRSPEDPSVIAIVEAGYAWSSSISRTPGLGTRANSPTPVRLATAAGHLLEIPPLSLANGLPVGGSWLGRLLPLPTVLRAAERMHAEAAPAVFTVHPWELDPTHPPDDFPIAARLMHHSGLARAEDRLIAVLEALGPASFLPIGAIARDLRPASPGLAPSGAASSF